MMVVSDTSVITALLTVGAAELLPRLSGEVVIPGAVRNELLRCHRQLPTWLRVEAVKDAVQVGRYASKRRTRPRCPTLELEASVRFPSFNDLNSDKTRQLTATSELR